MNDYVKLSSLMERVIHKYNQWESKKRTYGTSVPLSRAEIHTIAAVGDHPNINITTLAVVLGITKGAASQMIYKLVDKGAVEKRVSPDSDSEVVLNLTEQGQINYEMHREYHRQTNEEILIMLRDNPQPLYDQLTELLSVFERSIDKRLNE